MGLAKNNAIARRTLPMREVLCGATAAHLCASLALTVYGLIRTKGKYLGADVSAVSNLTEIMVGHFLWRMALLPLLPLLILAAPLALLIRSTRFNLGLLGACFYVSTSLFLLASAPGAVARFPIISESPFAVTFAVLAGAAYLSSILCLRGGASRLIFCTYAASVTIIPHDVGRALWHTFSTDQLQDKKKLMVFVVDALRLDVTNAFTRSPHHVFRGFSHYGSTRKQYRLLVDGENPDLDRALFIPSIEELSTAGGDSSLVRIAKRSGHRMELLIDDPLTTNPASTGIPMENFTAPSKGAQEALAQSTYLLPFAAWAWNVVSQVEGLNPWSDFSAFLRDSERALQSADIVVAHTVWLQHAPYKRREFKAPLGSDWYLRPARDFLLLDGPPVPQDHDFIDAQAAYNARAQWLFRQLFEKMESISRRGDISIVVTSDHGQTFIESERRGHHYPGIHGYFVDEETFLIPFVPISGVQVTDPRLLSWRSLRAGIIRWIDGEKVLVLNGLSTDQDVAVPFIYTPAVGQHLNASSDRALQPQTIAREVVLRWDSSWTVPSDLTRRFPVWSRGKITTESVILSSPRIDSTPWLR